MVRNPRGANLLSLVFAILAASGIGVSGAQFGLVSWWPAEGDATDAVGGNDGELRNVGFEPGQVGLAFSFDGSQNTGVIIGDVPTLENLPGLTVEAWVCTTDPTGDRGIVTQHWSHEGNTPSWVLRTSFVNPGFASFGVGTTGGDTITNGELVSLTAIADGIFHHVAGTYDGAHVRLYVDGLLEAIVPQSGIVRDSTNEVVIGNYGSGNHPKPAPETFPSFSGLIDEAKVYDRALTVEEISATIGAAGPARSCLPAISVGIDIKPGSDPNCFNNNGNGVIPVAVLGSADFSVAQIDASTVMLQGMAVRVVGKKNNLMAHYEDVNDDGFVDLVVQIEDQDGVFEAGEGLATLTGMLNDGTSFEGTDTVCITQ